MGTTQHGLDFVKTLGLVGLAPNLPDINGILNVEIQQRHDGTDAIRLDGRRATAPTARSSRTS